MKKHIVIIDDEPAIRQSMSDIFTDEGYSVSCAEDGGSALTLLEKESPDLIFLDIWLPDSDGLKLLPGLKTEHPEVPIIMISGHGTIETAVQATKMGAFDFIEKPLSLDKLVITAANALTLSRLQEENLRLKRQYHENRLTGNCPAIIQLKEQIRIIAPTDGWVLIVGENGTGKELIAREIHRLSKRGDQPFIDVHCAAVPEELIEAELFGCEKGVGGALRRKHGKFEESHGGTIFLDEIGNLSLATQARILRVIEERTFTRLGSNQNIPVNVRIIAATNKNLEHEIHSGNFRRELFNRLDILPIQTLPLRERRDDIPILADTFLAGYFKEHGGSRHHLDPEAIDRLKIYHWPGNIRELKNLMERLAIMCDKELICSADLPPYLRNPEPTLTPNQFVWNHLLANDSLTEANKNFEKIYLGNKLDENDWNISKTAQRIGISRHSLQRKLKSLALKQSD
ncbi:MAG TPA: sigma-54-dependent Fis family transcriptional regulator [Proteobacteria bacterium]|nr:sigma-54-dependent Fis family transcriptional regulator [Pseudomonadota bacterium]